MEDPKGQRFFFGLFQELMGQPGGLFGSDSGAAEIGMDMLRFMQDLPLTAVLHFQDKALSQSPEEVVDGLLRQVREQ